MPKISTHAQMVQAPIWSEPDFHFHPNPAPRDIMNHRFFSLRQLSVRENFLFRVGEYCLKYRW